MLTAAREGDATGTLAALDGSGRCAHSGTDEGPRVGDARSTAISVHGEEAVGSAKKARLGWSREALKSNGAYGEAMTVTWSFR